MLAPGNATRPLTPFEHEPRVLVAFARVGPAATLVVRVFASGRRARLGRFLPAVRLGVHPHGGGPLHPRNDGTTDMQRAVINLPVRVHGPKY